MVRCVTGGGAAGPREPTTRADASSATFACPAGLIAGTGIAGDFCSDTCSPAGTCGRVTIFFGSLYGPMWPRLRLWLRSPVVALTACSVAERLCVARNNLSGSLRARGAPPRQHLREDYCPFVQSETC